MVKVQVHYEFLKINQLVVIVSVIVIVGGVMWRKQSFQYESIFFTLRHMRFFSLILHRRVSGITTLSLSFGKPYKLEKATTSSP